MEVCVQMVPLFSGSSGNAVFIQFGETRFLVDAGVSCKRISNALYSIGQDPRKLSAVFITHDHGDHIQGLDVFIRKYGVPVYATSNTWRGIRSSEKKPHDSYLDHTFLPDDSFFCENVEVLPFSTPHDTAGSVGYRFRGESFSMSVVTDLGSVTDGIIEGIKGSDAILIEANYNREMLWNGPYPWPLKKRVDSPSGHLCNTDCAKAMERLIKEGTRHFILAHLSAENNSPSIVRTEIEDFLGGSALYSDDHYFLSIANRAEPTDPVVLSPGDMSVAGVQLEWFSLLDTSGGAI